MMLHLLHSSPRSMSTTSSPCTRTKWDTEAQGHLRTVHTRQAQFLLHECFILLGLGALSAAYFTVQNGLQTGMLRVINCTYQACRQSCPVGWALLLRSLPSPLVHIPYQHFVYSYGQGTVKHLPGAIYCTYGAFSAQLLSLGLGIDSEKALPSSPRIVSPTGRLCAHMCGDIGADVKSYLLYRQGS